MASGHDGLFSRPGQGDQRKDRQLDTVNSRTARVDDVDRTIVAYVDIIAKLGIILSTKIHIPAKASTSPDGENATLWTQPPDGLAYSPQIVLKGSFSPQTEGAGLHARLA